MIFTALLDEEHLGPSASSVLEQNLRELATQNLIILRWSVQ